MGKQSIILNFSKTSERITSCDMCGKQFANRFQLGPHRRYCWARLNGDGADDFSASVSSSSGVNNSAESSDDDDDDADEDDEDDDVDDGSTEVD